MTDLIQLEPEAHAFAEVAARSPLLFTLGPEQGRLALDQVQSGTIRKPAVDMEDLTITDGPSAQVALRILRPQKAQAPLPVIVYIHGAGWVFGSTQTHDRLVRELAVGAGAAVVFPVYRLCPEVRYPTALEECYTAARWVGRFGREYGLDAERLAVAGDCVGGNLATVITLLSRERGEPDIRMQVLFYPDHRCGLRHGVLPPVRPGLPPATRYDDLVLGAIHPPPERAQRDHCLPAAGQHSAVARAPPGAHHYRRGRHCARRGGGLRQQAAAGRGARHGSAFPGHHP